MAGEFTKIIKSYCGDQNVEILGDSDFMEDLDLNSMDIINMIIDLEAAYKVSIKESMLKNVATVNDLKKLIEKLAKRSID